MSELILTQTQLEEAAGLLQTAFEQSLETSPTVAATEIAGSAKEVDSNYSDVPRPDFNAFKANYLSQLPDKTAGADGRHTITAATRHLLLEFGGLRGYAITVLDNKQTLAGPAIVLNNGQHIAMLVAERPEDVEAGVLSEIQHSLLEQEYVKDLALVSGQHTSNDVTNASALAPSLLVASSGLGANAHNDMHRLAGSGSSTFGNKFSHAGRQDFMVGHEQRKPRSITLPTSRVLMRIGEQDQLDPATTLLGLKLPASQLAVGFTLAANLTHQHVDLASNINNMLEG